MSVGKKIKLLLEIVDIYPDIPFNVGNWGPIRIKPETSKCL
jgi:hypothetical protein